MIIDIESDSDKCLYIDDNTGKKIKFKLDFVQHAKLRLKV